MADFDILGHFSVRLPTAPALPRQPAPALVPKSLVVLAPREKAPRPQASVARSAARSNSIDVGAAPAGRVVVFDAPVPCNDFINQQAALARQREREARRLRDQQLAVREQDLFAFRTSRAAPSASEKEVMRVEMERAVEAARLDKAARRERELRDARAALEFVDAATEKERVAMEAKRQASVGLREELQRRAEEARAARKTQRSQSAHADPERGVEPIYLQATAEQEAATREATKQRHAELQQYWLHQMEHKRSASAANRDRERALAAEADMIAGHEERQDQKRVAEAKAEARRNAQLATNHRSAAQERARREREQERASAEAELAAAHAAQRREAAVKVERQLALRDEIQRLMVERRQHLQHHAAAEKRAERVRSQVTEQTNAQFQDVLYRCPATGRVLPPAAFNIPRAAWQAPSRAMLL